MINVPQCYICKQSEADSPEVELRPYGPKGTWLCYDCMVASPEREVEAKKQFGAQLDACGDIAVVDGSNTGPRPFNYFVKFVTGKN